MKRSTNRILTPHPGSLRGPADLLAMAAAIERGGGDLAAFEARVPSAVAEIVHKQVEAGVDIVNDGEQGKPSYATYVKDRLTGFEEGGTTEQMMMVQADMADFPEYRTRYAARRAEAGAGLRRPACTGAVSYKDRKAVVKGNSKLKAPVAQCKPAQSFVR